MSRHGSRSLPSGTRAQGVVGAATGRSRLQVSRQDPEGREARQGNEGGIRSVAVRAVELSACCVTAFLASILLVAVLITLGAIAYAPLKMVRPGATSTPTSPGSP